MKIRSNAISGILWIGIWIVSSAVVLKLDGIAQRDYGISLIPFGIISLMAFVLCVVYACKLKRTRFKLLLAYISVIPLCVCMGEVWGYIQSKSTQAESNTQTLGSYTTHYYDSSNITGYKAKPNVVATSKRIINDEVIYDVSYTTDWRGYRKTPNSNEDSKKCLLFLGDSFAIGEGLNDNQTLPFFINEILHIRVFNYGFHGYGPHQALALLQSGIIKENLKNCTNIVAFYISLPTHIARANGFSAWEDTNFFPYLTLRGDTLVWHNFNGKENNPFVSFKRKIFSRLEKSYLYKALKPKYQPNQSYNNVYFAIIRAIDTSLQEQFGARLHLILWDKNNLSSPTEVLESDVISAWLESQSFYAIKISQIISDYTTNRLRYGIHPNDLHPNALANELIAQYIATRIQSGAIELTKIPNNKRESSLDSNAIKSKE